MEALLIEKNIIEMFPLNKQVNYNKQEYYVDCCAKPTYPNGEGKTDIYLRLKNKNNTEEVKISIKNTNADFLENKLNSKRAEIIFGKNWSNIITNVASSIKEAFIKRQLYYPEKTGRVSAGSYTMGWRLDILNKNSGQLSCPVVFTKKQKEEIFLGTNLSDEKRNGFVFGKVIENCGIANRILLKAELYQTAQQVLDALILIDDYNPDLFLAFKAVNYRSIEDKIDGNRPLAVWVDWSQEKPEIIFDSPLIFGAKNDILKTFKQRSF